MAADRLVEDLAARLRWVEGHADIWAVFADADLLARTVAAVVAPYQRDAITHVVGIDSRGFILGGAAAIALGAGFVAVRKSRGHLPGELLTSTSGADYKQEVVRLRLQRARLGAASRVLIVDDWFETGSQFSAARGLAENAGATVVGASVVVDQTPTTLRATLGKYRYLVRAAELRPDVTPVLP